MCTQKKAHVRTWRRQHLSAEERPQEKRFCLHRDLGLLASRTLRKLISVSEPVCGTLLRPPCQASTPGIILPWLSREHSAQQAAPWQWRGLRCLDLIPPHCLPIPGHYAHLCKDDGVPQCPPCCSPDQPLRVKG